MKFDLTQIILAILTVVVIPLVKVLYSDIKTKFTVNQWNTIIKLVNDGVQAAETLPKFVNLKKAGVQKFDYVLKSVVDAANKMGFAFDETAVKNAIQAAWKNLIGSSSNETKVETK